MVNYAYNGDDQRVGHGSGGALTGELYAGASAGSPLLQNSDGTYTPGVSQHGTGGSAYFAADALGSTRGITGGTGTATDALLYDAFGETLTRSGSTATPVQFAGTSGYQADATTGLQLLGHRYYDASIGRFLSSDPAQAGSNWYAYCDNNLVGWVDPTWLRKIFGFPITWGEIGGVVGGAIGGVFGPVGIGIGAGIGTAIGDRYGDHDGWGDSIKDGIVNGGLAWIGGRILGPAAEWGKSILFPEPIILPLPENLWQLGKYWRWID